MALKRVVVSQLIRSAGVFFTSEPHGATSTYGAKFIPAVVLGLEFEPLLMVLFTSR